MQKLFFEGKEVPSIEGVVQFVSAQNYRVRDQGLHLLIIQIDTFNRGELCIHNGDYRIDRGEKVRLYSKEGFQETQDDGNNFYIHGVQILDEQGEVKFQSTHTSDVVFE